MYISEVDEGLTALSVLQYQSSLRLGNENVEIRDLRNRSGGAHSWPQICLVKQTCLSDSTYIAYPACRLMQQVYISRIGMFRACQFALGN